MGTLEKKEVSVTKILESLREGDKIRITLKAGTQEITALRAVLENILYKNFCGTRSGIQGIAMNGTVLLESRSFETVFKAPLVIGPEWVAHRIKGHVRIEKIEHIA